MTGSVDVVLERFDLDGLFDAVVCAADLDGPGKPEPDIYERAAAELGVDPENAVAVEDSLHGTTAARRAGMTVVGFAVGEARVMRGNRASRSRERQSRERGGGLSEADVVAETPEALREQLLGRL